MAKKIFELAKEMNLGAIELVEKLKAGGFAVRNHMSELSDEDLTKVAELFAPKEAETSPPKKVVKKVVKKKTEGTPAKSSPATVSSTGIATAEANKDLDKKSDAAKKKGIVVRKKGMIAETTDKENSTDMQQHYEAVETEQSHEMADDVTTEERVEFNEIENNAVEAENITDIEVGQHKTPDHSDENKEIASVATPQISTSKRPSRPSGLRVVSVPVVSEKKVVATPEKHSSAQDKGGQPEEKVHRFTPVYIPPAATAGGKKVATELVEFDDADSKDEKNHSKKRMGGLASMMSGKIKGGAKIRDINLFRAEDELKSYTALGSLGRPLYSQMKKKKIYNGPSDYTHITETKESKRVIHLHQGGTILEIAQKLKIKFEALADQVLDINLLVNPEDYVGIKLAQEIAALYSYRVEDVAFDEQEVIGKVELSEDQKNNLPLRNPIITIMGHVDHGKTTLLDYIRHEKVAAGEAGGITQHIGAYSVKVGDSTLTFLDTPGHAAFAAMRQRGAQVTDIVVLVVAADDGVMPQTVESIRFCKNVEVPMIVAINKMDKEGANPDRIKQALTEFEITPEEWGGTTQFVNISALKGDGVDNLLEAIALQAEILELRADPKGPAQGFVVESKIEQGRGPVATVLIQSGTLTKGDYVVVGECYGRARSLTDHRGEQLQEAGPSTPVQILGIDEPPNPGDILHTVKNEREAKKIVSNRTTERKELEQSPTQKKLSLEDFFTLSQDSTSDRKELKLVIRADVNGSFEAIKQSVEPLSNSEVAVKVIGGGVGPITDSDVSLASSSSGFIIGFNMRPVTTARKLAELKGVDIKTYSIIYELLNDIKLAMEGLLTPETSEAFIGRAEVKDTFVIPKVGVIAGSMVIDGKIERGCKIRLLRDGKIVHDGQLSSLKRFKDDAKEVNNGYECGIALEKFNDIKVGDIFEAYKIEIKKRTLEDVAKDEAKAAKNSAKAEHHASV